ncbi:MAG: hypothetical protein NC098_09525 [Lachnoclostridium sp.]|nr:hypothetical protein [Lachnoclostridium sp.]
MKKIYILSILFAMVALGPKVSAAGFHTLKVMLTDDTQSEFVLSDEFKASFTADALHIFTSSKEIDIPKDQVKSFVFSEDGGAGISDVEVAGQQAQFDGETLTVTGLKAGSVVAVYGVDGRCLSKAEATGEYVINLGELTKGVVIVNVNGVSYKINVK